MHRLTHYITVYFPRPAELLKAKRDAKRLGYSFSALIVALLSQIPKRGRKFKVEL